MARQFTWIPPSGEPIVLNDEAAGYRLKAAGTRGLSSPTYRMTRSSYAAVDGTTLDAVSADEREISLGLQVQAYTEAEFRARWRTLVRAFRPKAGDGTLQVADEFGAVRSITCRYAGGMEGDGEAEFSGTEGRAVVKLLAFDPWWYGELRAVSFGLGAPVPFFPIFPLVLSPSTVQGSFTADLSDSDSPAYPVWTVTGPGTSLVLTNETTGRTISVNADLAAGETLIIDTRPGFQSVRRGDGTNLMGSVTSDPALWPLIEDVNEISAQLTDATAASRIAGVYRPRYAGI